MSKKHGEYGMNILWGSISWASNPGPDLQHHRCAQGKPTLSNATTHVQKLHASVVNRRDPTLYFRGPISGDIRPRARFLTSPLCSVDHDLSNATSHVQELHIPLVNRRDPSSKLRGPFTDITAVLRGPLFIATTRVQQLHV